jgi:hypothetical protein
LSFADTTKLKQEGRNFDCSKCPVKVQELRRCWDPREDFTSEDSAVFPMYITSTSTLYGFCPGKVSREPEVLQYYRLLVITVETGNLPHTGGIMDQDANFISDLGWFIPAYGMTKWAGIASSLLGGGSANKAQGKIPATRTRRR